MKRRDFLSASAALGAGSALGLQIAPVHAQDGQVGLVAAHRFAVGSATVTAFSDGFLPIGPEMLNGVTPEAYAQLLSDAYITSDAHPTGVNAYLVETEGQRILVDAGTGPAMGPGLGKIVQTMTALGIAPESIDVLVATHLHPDHIGGTLTMGLSNATLKVGQADIDFWSSADIRAQAPADFHPFFDLAVGTLDGFGDRVEAVTGEADLGAGLTAIPLPGHTMGHMGVRLDNGGESLLFWGDIVHVGPVQFAQPEVTIAFDTDQDLARKTRAMVLDMAATDRLMIAGAHIAFPGVGYVERAQSGYHYQPAPWPYGG